VLSVDEALARAVASVLAPKAEMVQLMDADGRVLFEDVTAPHPLPPWDNSAMDGLALRAADTTEGSTPPPDTDPCVAPASAKNRGRWLEIVETIAAGDTPTREIGPGQAAKIMTGAPLPIGADAVVMREHATEDGERVRVHQSATVGQHIRRQGENAPVGSVVATRGQTLTPSLLGLCAAVGRAEVCVARKPRVGIVSTGNEVVRPGSPIGPGQIYSSNSVALASWIRHAGGEPEDCGIARDDLESTKNAFTRASACDLIVSTGGVSVGDFDVVVQAMTELGASMEFWKVRMKPGKPLALGIIGDVPAFGLPGNPVSAQVGFLQFVRPWIRMSLGDPKPHLPVVDATLAFDFQKKGGRVEFARVSLVWTPLGWEAHKTGDSGSGNQLSMARANGLLLAQEEALSLPKGSPVRVQVLNGGLSEDSSPNYPW
jgi:molybdopterin molybdotransferase